MEIVRATKTAQLAGAYYVRIQAMARKYHLTLEQEFDEHDGPDAMYIVLIDDYLPVATCRLYPINEECMMLGRIVVLPEYRGQGLGRLAVESAEVWAKELGYKKAVLESREGKVGFYQKLGYTPDFDVVIHGETFTCIYMEKELL